jgi:hypothetical protein
VTKGLPDGGIAVEPGRLHVHLMAHEDDAGVVELFHQLPILGHLPAYRHSKIIWLDYRKKIDWQTKKVKNLYTKDSSYREGFRRSNLSSFNPFF